MPTYMDPVLFKAAAEGDIGPFENYQTRLDQLLTPDENTILHVYLGNQRREPEFTDFVVIILEMCPPLLFQANKKGEIPLHFAARYGHSNVVRVLIDRAKARPTDPESGVTEAKKMLRMTTEEQDTALHEAARHRQQDVVAILTEEDHEFSYSANVHGETPLYIAAASSSGTRVIDEILANCISVDYGGPNGRTALHEASRRGDHETARKLLEKEKKLTKRTDENGWSPLHYAAYYDWYSSRILLENDASAAYIAETEKKRTALHIAAIQGRVGVMELIVSGCPACCELVDNRGWNALHYALASKSIYVFEKCMEIPELARLGTKKDEKGNTPFHLIAALAHQQEEWRRVLYEYSHSEGEIPELCGLNKRKLSVNDIYSGNFGEIQTATKFESIAETEKKRTALHIAAIQGSEIVSGCPACCELVDNRGWNALHHAVASKDKAVFEECLRIPLLDRLKTKKDDNGDTPFHLIAALDREQKQWRRVLYKYIYNARDIYGLNKRTLSVKDICFGDFAEIQVINPL
ncbi:hypothetical protein POTOM_059610 [Populus tomentosa]|uniref:Ankyrin repeat family protein n=1 Tax=Populus tomentosa TaxID=118781 RepID=A0A8X8C018_POPTO|nr:hypothetical protein POTOM_059610 [Populus tomentosa]